MSGADIILAGCRYSTKKAVARLCQVIIAQSKDYALLAPGDAYVVSTLFWRHPEHAEKAGCGIAGFSVEPDTRWKTTRHFVVVRIDGTTVDFSWKKCIDGKLPDKRTDALAALRDAVADQVIEFRRRAFANQNSLVCPLTGLVISEADCHVDHVSPLTFAALVDSWLEVNRLSFNEVNLVRSSDGYGWTMPESDQKQSWCSFHRQHCHLRVLSRSANLSQAKAAKLTAE